MTPRYCSECSVQVRQGFPFGRSMLFCTTTCLNRYRKRSGAANNPNSKTNRNKEKSK